MYKIMYTNVHKIMKMISFTEFRKHAATYLNEVESGETLRILRHGKPVADIVPTGQGPGLPSWKRPFQPLKIDNVSLTQNVIDERRSES